MSTIGIKKGSYTQHRYECLACRKIGILVPENWITGVCKFCASDMILPIKDLETDQNIIFFPFDFKHKKTLELNNRAEVPQQRSSKMELIKSLEVLIESAMSKKFGEQIKQNMFGNIRQFNAMQLEMVKYRTSGNMGLLNRFLKHLKNTVAGTETLEETSTHYLFTQRISQSGTLTIALDKNEIEDCVKRLQEL